MNKKTNKVLASAAVMSLVMTSTLTGLAGTAKAASTELGGSNRVDTAVKIADELLKDSEWKNSHKAILAPGNDVNLADALAASPLSYKEKAPIYLNTYKDSINKETMEAFKKNGVKTVYIVTGKGIISEKAEKQLTDAKIKVERLAGKNRMATAEAIMAKVGDFKEAVVVGYNGIPDALSISSIAARKGMPIVIANADGSVAANLKGKKVYALGGKTLVSEKTEKDLNATRLFGLNRFETNAKIMEAFKDSLKFDKVYLANGADSHMVDALTGSPLAAKTSSAVVLGTDKLQEKQSETLVGKVNEKTEVITLGKSVSDNLIKEVKGIANKEILKVVAVEEVTKEVKVGTTADKLELPKEVKVTLSDKTVEKANVAWDTAKFDGSKAAEVTVKGTLSVPEGKKFIIPENLKEVQAKVKVGQGRLSVETVNAVNARNVKVTFPENFEIKAEDLKDKKIVLKAENVELTATYANGSLNQNTAIFSIDDKKELTDATVYTVSSDWSNFTKADFVAKIARPYAKTFEAVTTKVASNVDKDEKVNEVKVTFTAKDQYKDNIKLDAATGANLKVKGTLNGMPLSESEEEIKLEDTKDSVKIKKALKEGDKLSITVENYSGDKVIGSSNFEYTVAKAEKAVATSIASIKVTKEGKEVKEVVALDELKLKADVRDQFNNSVDNSKVRWVVTEGAELLDNGADGKLGKDKVTLDKNAKEEVSLKVIKPGKVVVEAYNVQNGAKATYVVEAGATKLNKLEVPGDFDGSFNNEEVKTVGKFKVNDGAALSIEAIKFNVVSKTTGVEASDIKVSAQYRGGDDKETKNDIILVVKSSKAGKYEITPYVGEAFDAKEVVKGDTVSIETKLNNIATVIDAVEIPTLKVGTSVEKEIVIKNKHNEVITSELKDTDLDITVFKDGQKVDENNLLKVEGLNNKDGKLEKIKITAKKSGKFVVRIGVKGKAAFTEVKVSAEATKLTSIDLGQDIYDGVISGDKEKVYRIIDVRDNKGDSIIPNVATWKVEGSDAIQVKTVAKDKDGKWAVVDQDKAEAIALVINPENLVETKEAPLSIKVTNGEAGEAKVESSAINVTVKEARKISKINVVNKVVSAGLAGKTEVSFALVDQYGKAYTISNLDDIVVKSNDEVKVAVEKLSAYDKDGVKTEALDKAVSYKFELTGKSSGSTTVDITSKDGKIKEAVNVTVAPVVELVKSIEFSNKNLNDNGTYKYPLEKGKEAVTLTIQAKDVNGNLVAVNPDEVIWTSSNEKVATVNNGIVTTEDVEKDEKVTITADVFGVKKSITFTVSASEPKLDENTVTIKDADKIDADKSKDGIQVSLDGKIEDGETEEGVITLTFEGKDQFGNKAKKVEGVALSFNPEVVTVDKDVTDTLTITPVKVGETKVRFTVGAKDIVVDVKVTEDNATIKKIAADKVAAEEAVKADKKAIKEAVEKVTDVELEEEVTDEKVKKAIQDEIVDKEIKVEVKAVESEEGSYEVTLTKGKATEKKSIKATKKAQ